MRAADFKWYWGANGAVDSVVDVTHHVRVPFSPKVRASWGILNDSSFTSTAVCELTFDGNNAKLTWADTVLRRRRSERSSAASTSCGGAGPGLRRRS